MGKKRTFAVSPDEGIIQLNVPLTPEQKEKYKNYPGLKKKPTLHSKGSFITKGKDYIKDLL